MGKCRSYRPRKRKFHGNQNTSTETASSNEEIMTASSLKLQQCNEVSNEDSQCSVPWSKSKKQVGGKRKKVANRSNGCRSTRTALKRAVERLAQLPPKDQYVVGRVAKKTGSMERIDDATVL
ncbi:hypothetical protein TNCV_2508311 [Trichonephila clavipes]|nr:hypothetical protein TNCV_2508311 [Trichonephila clavipes]